MKCLLQSGGQRVFLLALLPLALLAATGMASGQPMDFNFVDTSVTDALHTIVVKIMGADIVLDESVTGDIPRLQLTQKEPEETLTLLCQQRGLHWWKQGNVYFVSGKPRADVPSEPAASTPAAPRLTHEIIPLQHANPQDIAYLFGGARYAATPGYAAAATGSQSGDQVMREATEAIRVRRGLNGANPFGATKPGTLEQYPSFPGTTVVQPGVPGATPEAVTPGAEEEQPLTGPLSRLLPEGLSGPPVALPMLNAIIVSGSEDAIDEFRKLVELLDVKVKQVLIEAHFVTINVNDLATVGVDWSAIAPNVDVAASGLAPSTAEGAANFTIGWTSRNLRAILASVTSGSHARLVSSPKVATMNNMPANIYFESVFPFFEQSSVVQPGITGGQVITGSVLNTVYIRSGLYVVPKVNEDNSVTVTLSPTVNDVTSTITGPGGSIIPIVSGRGLQTTLTVKNGETIVMGGFVRSTFTRNRNRIPLLSDIPLIGKLFQSSNRNDVQEELLIFLSASIVPDATPGPLTVSEPVP